MKKLLSIMLVAVTMVSVTAFSNAQADTYDFGQLGSGDIYRVRNLSDNQTDFVKTANADLCETVQFKARVHNAGPKVLTNVKVKVALPSGTGTNLSSTVTVTADNNREDAVATGSANVVLSNSGSMNYVSGSAELLDNNGGTIKSLSDSVVTNGVNIGDVAVSLNNMRFVQLKAKINCPEVPQDKDITVCRLSDKQVVTIKESQYNANLYSKDLKDCADKPEQPGEITVCELESGKIVTISEDAYDSSKYSKDLKNAACVEEETPVVTELPQTGAGSLLAGLVLSTIAAGIAYALGSRKNLLG